MLLRTIILQLLSPHDRPAVFRVPDSSDEEDSVSDDDEVVDSSMAIMRGAGMASLPPDQTATVSAIDLTQDEVSTAKAIDASANTLPSDEIISDDKPESVHNLSDCAPELVESLDTLSEAQFSLHHRGSSLVINTDEEESSNDGEEGHYEEICDDKPHDMDELERSHISPYHPLEYDSSEPELCQSALTYSQPSNCAKRSTDLGDPDDSYQEGHASEDADSLRAFSEPKCSSQTQKAELEESTPSPQGAIFDATLTPDKQSFINFMRFEASRKNSYTAARDRADFFAAREHNRRVHAGQIKIPAGTIHGSSNDIAEYEESLSSFSPLSPMSNNSRLCKSSTCTTTAALLASGEKLLQDPPVADVAPANSICMDDLFDDSSAFAYQMSKKSISPSAHLTAISEVEETKLSDDDEFEPPQALPLEVMRHSRKRKSDEISILLPTEVETRSSQTQFESSQPTETMQR